MMRALNVRGEGDRDSLAIEAEQQEMRAKNATGTGKDDTCTQVYKCLAASE